MALRGIRLRGETYVRVDDVVNSLRKHAGRYIIEMPNNPFAQATALAIHAEADSLEKSFKDWRNKADDTEIKRKFI